MPKAATSILALCLAVALMTVCLHFFVTSHYAIGADFSIYWNGAKALLLERISPYQSLVSERIQIALYGRPALPGEDQVRYAYPPFSLIVVLPSVFMTFAWADAYWMALNLVALFTAVAASFRHIPRWVLVSIVFFLPVARSLILGQYALLLGSCLLAIYGLIGKSGRVSRIPQLAAGALLAWCLMKPQLTLLFVLFFLLLALRQRQWGVCYGLVGGCLTLGLLSFWWLPDWVGQWRALVMDYVGYVPIQPLYRTYANGLVLGSRNTWLEAGILVVAVLAVLWTAWQWWQKPHADMLLLMSLAVLVQLISPNPKSMISDQIVLLLPVLIWIADRPSHFRWDKPLWWATFVVSAWLTFAVFFAGQEPLQAEATLPLIGAAWLVWVCLTNPSTTQMQRLAYEIGEAPESHSRLAGIVVSGRLAPCCHDLANVSQDRADAFFL
jgi:hypothetical protein